MVVFWGDQEEVSAVVGSGERWGALGLPSGFPKELPKRILRLERGMKVSWAAPAGDPGLSAGLDGPSNGTYSEWADMCLCLAIKSVLAFTRFHCVVAVIFGSVIVAGSEATQKCFCELSTPHSPVVQSRRKAHSSLLALSRGICSLAAVAPLEGPGLRVGEQRWVEVYLPGPASCLTEVC